jgi:concanavalin A-like lectin/glucanase superfamily protein
MRARSTLRAVLLASAFLLIPMGATAAHRSDHSLAQASSALVLRYAFDNDANGIVRDASPSALNGTLINADPATAYTASVPGWGRALTLVGAQHQYVAVPERNVLDVNRYTLAALIRYTGVENDSTFGRWEVLEKAGAYWMNIRTNGRVRVGGFVGSCKNGPAWKFIDSTRPIPTNTWTHVASTYNGSRLTVWIDGQRAGSRAVSGKTCANNEPLAIGAKNAPSKGLLEAFWDGRLDEVRIYQRALTATEIGQLVP